jgi:N-acetylmuramoyl-L-alanine amidase
MTKYNPTVIKERIYASNGVLKYVDLNSGSPYSTKATDVRFLKLDKSKIKLKMVWENGAKVSELVQKYGADFGINAPFFTYYNGGYIPVADCKIGDKVLNTGYDTPNGAQQTKWHGFAYKNGASSIGMFNINDNYGADGFMFKTTPLLIDNGNPCWDYFRVQDGTASDIGKDANGNYVRCQRTFIGIDKDGNLLICIADGRTAWDQGLTLEEMCLYMQAKGAIYALNLDGGSSTVLADTSGSLGQNSGTYERAVNHAVLVYCLDDLQEQRQKAYDVQNEVNFMYSLVDGSGSGTELWALDYFGQVYDIMKSKGLL